MSFHLKRRWLKIESSFNQMPGVSTAGFFYKYSIDPDSGHGSLEYLSYSGDVSAKIFHGRAFQDIEYIHSNWVFGILSQCIIHVVQKFEVDT